MVAGAAALASNLAHTRAMDLHLPTTPNGLILARTAQRHGLRSTLNTALGAGSVTPLRRGIYVASDTAQTAGPRERHRQLALAVGHQRKQAVFAGFTAAVLWGLPVVGAVPSAVYLLSPTASGRQRNGVIEFAGKPGIQLAEHQGLILTSIAETLVDVARTMPMLTALAMFDAALHVPRFGQVPPLCTADELGEAFHRRLPFHGSQRVRALLDWATPLVESPLESLSRVRFDELGVPAPVLQYPVWLPRSNRTVHLDFAWPEYGVWGEADGDGKYLGNSVSSGDRRSPGEIVSAEKKRENEVRAVLDWRCGRWDWGEAWHAATLRAILRELGLPLA